jgi:hypothetical protein
MVLAPELRGRIQRLRRSRVFIGFLGSFRCRSRTGRRVIVFWWVDVWVNVAPSLAGRGFGVVGREPGLRRLGLERKQAGESAGELAVKGHFIVEKKFGRARGVGRAATPGS